MQTQLRVLQSEQVKGKYASKVGAATEELQYLNFSNSITQCVVKAMEHLCDFAFVSMANVTLVRRNPYLTHAKTGLKQDTLAALHQAPLDLPTLFLDSVLKRAEEDIGRFEDKDSLVAGGTIISTLTRGRITSHWNKSLVNQL